LGSECDGDGAGDGAGDGDGDDGSSGYINPLDYGGRSSAQERR